MAIDQNREAAERALTQLIEPDTLLPSQFADRHNPEPSSYPEKRLMLAVLEDAVASYQRYLDAEDTRSKRLFAETEEWIASEDKEWPFSFDNICLALQIEPEYLRNGLQGWKAKQEEAARSGAKVYRFPFRRVNGSRHQITTRGEGMRESA